MCDLWQLRPGTGQSGTRSRVAALAGEMWAPIIQLRNKIVPAVEGCSRVQSAATMHVWRIVDIDIYLFG